LSLSALRSPESSSLVVKRSGVEKTYLELSREQPST
jgi:hypothetical protein